MKRVSSPETQIAAKPLDASSDAASTIYITVLDRTDFEHPIFSIISFQSCFYRNGPFIKNVSFVKTQKNISYKIGEQSL